MSPRASIIEIARADRRRRPDRPCARGRSRPAWRRGAAGRGAREQARPRQDAGGQRPHHGVLPAAWHRRQGAQLGLSARLGARQRIRHRHARLRARPRAHARARRAAALGVQPGARPAVSADLVRSDPAGLRAVVSADRDPPPRQARKFHAGCRWRDRDRARSAKRTRRNDPRGLSGRLRRIRLDGARAARHRADGASRISTGR